jgi:spore coat polysaccharide biosynthesis protein SpsF
MRTVVVIQARMGSTRLPGKVLLPLSDRPVLAHVVERCRLSLADEVVVATSVMPGDDVLEAWCAHEGYPLLRGDEDDVLSRYVAAARREDADVVVLVTADCPAIDPATTDRVIRALIESGNDYASIRAEETSPSALPRGLNVEALTREALEDVARRASQPRHREHVTLLVHEDPTFGVLRLDAPEGLARPHYRMTLDTPADYAMLLRLFAECPVTPETPLEEMIAFLDDHPDVPALNAAVEQKKP